jgi:GntR family transcriptional regulator/MocR family aminotransferase
MIRRGLVAAGTRLPATRALARTLEVNRKTVEAAYDELAARRLVAVRPGRAATVRASIPERPELDLPFRAARARDPLPAEAWAEAGTPAPQRIDLAGSGPRLRHFPAGSLRRIHARALALGGALFTPPPPLGEAALRRAAAGLLAQCGVLRDADEIVVFASRRDAFAAMLELFVPAGGVVLLDGLVDPEIGAALHERGARCETLPPGDDLSGDVGPRERLRLIVATTGMSRLSVPGPGVARRRALLDLARERHVPVAEDLSGGDRLPPPPLPPLAALDTTGRVFPLADLSDEVGGDLRAAVCAVTAKALERLRAHAPGLAAARPDRLAQRVLAGALEWPGRLRAQRALREKRRLLVPSVRRTIRRRLAALPEPEFSAGGDAARIPLPPPLGSEALARAARDRGVLLCGARDCGAPPGAPDFLWLDLTRHEEGDLLEGIRLLGEVVDAALAALPAAAVPGASRG